MNPTHFIDGRRVPSEGNATIDVIDPSDGERFGQLAAAPRATSMPP